MTTLKNRHVNLTQTELRIAAYVRMGLSTKEISELLQKTTKAVDNERYRLRKKLDVPLNNSLKSYLLDL
jgi:DNA-binding CsgD family transcriptional regulator